MNRFKFILKFAFLTYAVVFLTSNLYHVELETSTTTENELVESKTAEEIKLYNLQKELVENAVQDYFKRAIGSGQIVGVGISVVKGDSILLSSGYGRKKIATNDNVNGETVFRLGSLSKGFAGILVGKLKSDELLDWDDKVTNYLSDFNFNNSQNTNAITLSHILSHTSGAPYHSYTDLVEAGVDLRKIATKFKTVKPISEPGEMYSYQNAMFALSSEITSCITGNSINEDLDTYFFKPLGMHTTSTDHESLMNTDNKAYPHRKYRKTHRSLKLTDKYYNAVAAGGVNASPLDMAKWMRFLMGHNADIMTANELSEVFKPVIKVNGKRKYYQKWEGHQSSYYAHGWRIHKYNDNTNQEAKTIIHHGGSVNNFRNEIALFPGDDLGICVLFNSTPQLAKQVIPDLYAIISEIYQETEQVSEVSMN